MLPRWFVTDCTNDRLAVPPEPHDRAGRPARQDDDTEVGHTLTHLISSLRSTRAIRHTLFALLFLAPVILAACTPEHNQSTFGTAGPVAEDQKNIFLFIFWVAVAVMVPVEGALIYFAIRYRRTRRTEGMPEQTHGNTAVEIAWTIAPAIVLVAIAIPTVDLIYKQSRGPSGGITPENPVEIRVIAHQWWWEIEYPGEDVVTANEVHIPTGRAIRLEMTSDDVIHSFWVPKLGGKVDIVPASTNELWLQADEQLQPGETRVFLGQCAEFCGEGHALMRYRVIAHEPGDYESWLDSMRRPSARPTAGSDEEYGQTLFAVNCSMCHSTRTFETALARAERKTQIARQAVFVANPEGARIIAAPNLTHFATRLTIGAGLVDFDPEDEQKNLEIVKQWVQDPKNIKRVTRMRKLALVYDGGPIKLRDEEIAQITSYLLSLKPVAAGEEVPAEPTTRPPEVLFTELGCSGCHDKSDNPTSGTPIGPGLGALKGRAGDREPPKTAVEYVRESIVNPSAFVVDGFSDVMPKTFEDMMSPQEIDDLVEYLLSLE